MICVGASRRRRRKERKVRSFAVLHDEASAKTEQEVAAARQSLIEWSEERKRKAEERRKQREEERKREAERKRQEERAALLVELNALYQQITGSDEHTLTCGRSPFCCDDFSQLMRCAEQSTVADLSWRGHRGGDDRSFRSGHRLPSSLSRRARSRQGLQCESAHRADSEAAESSRNTSSTSSVDHAQV